MRNVVLAFLMLFAALLATGCASGRADAGAANPTLSWSAGVLAVERADTVRTEVQVSAWPIGMDRWSPEQITAFIQARGTSGNPGAVGDLFYSRQDVKVGTDQQGGSGSATQETPVNLNADLSGASLGAAKAAGKALGLGAGGSGEASGSGEK